MWEAFDCNRHARRSKFLKLSFFFLKYLTHLRLPIVIITNPPDSMIVWKHRSCAIQFYYDYVNSPPLEHDTCVLLTSPCVPVLSQSSPCRCNVQEPPPCRVACKQCDDDATCKAILEAWQTACASLKGKKVKTCDVRCTEAGSMLRRNILGSRVWGCLKGSNKTLKTRYMKLCLD